MYQLNGLCECGCGQITNLWKQTDNKRGYKKGDHKRFIDGHHVRIKELRPNNEGENNPMFKGDNVGYGAVHIWVKARKPKPDLCDFCKEKPPCDLANKSGLYKRDLNDWNYLCRKCHMDSDGRNEQLRQSGRSRKLPSAACPICSAEYYATKYGVLLKHCSRECWLKSLSGKIGNLSGKYNKKTT